MKKKTVYIILQVLVLLLFAGAIAFRVTHRISPYYNDAWIKGRTYEEIVARYGQTMKEKRISGTEHHAAYKRINRADDRYMYYCIEFDENDRAVKVYMNGEPW